jgi:hypothetical protein
VPAREPLLDRRLALEQPIHRRVQLIVDRALHPQLFPQRAAVQLSRARELRAALEHPAGDHRQAQIPLARGLAVQQPRHAQPPNGREHRLHMPVLARADDLERLARWHQPYALERQRQRLDRLRRQLGHIRDRLVAHPPALADRAADQVGVVLAVPMTPTDLGHMHRADWSRTATQCATSADHCQEYSWLHLPACERLRPQQPQGIAADQRPFFTRNFGLVLRGGNVGTGARAR